MRKWEVALRRESEAFDDFLAWLAEIETRELQKMLTIGPDEHDKQRGIVMGIQAIRFQALANSREETLRAGRKAQAPE